MSVQSSVRRAAERYAKWWRWWRVPLALVFVAALVIAVVADNRGVAAVAAVVAAAAALGATTIAGSAGEAAHRAARANTDAIGRVDRRVDEGDLALDSLATSLAERMDRLARDAHRAAMSDLVIVIAMQPRMPETLDLAMGVAQDLLGAEVVLVDRAGDADLNSTAKAAAKATPGLRLVTSSQSVSIQEDVNQVVADTSRRCLAVLPRSYLTELAATMPETRPLLPPAHVSEIAARAPSEHPQLVSYQVEALREVEGFTDSVELSRDLVKRFKAAGYRVEV